MRSERVVGGRHAVEQRIQLSVLNAKLLQVRCGLGHLWIRNPRENDLM